MLRHYFTVFIFLIFYPTLNYAADSTSPTKTILLFDSSIVVNKDASIDVTEIISMAANGIKRELPATYTDRKNASHPIHYKIQQVLINGNKSAYNTKESPDKITIIIGSETAPLPAGIYSYTIQYHVDHAVSVTGKQNEFNWNITGNHSEAMISKLQADIELPDTVKTTQAVVFAGKTNEKHNSFVLSQPSGNQVAIVTTQPLQPDESVRVELAWPSV